MKKITIFIALLFLLESTQAKYFTGLGGSGVEIIKYFTHNNGSVSLLISDPNSQITNLDGCVVTNRVYIDVNMSGHKEMLASALSAFHANKRVGIHASGCVTTGFWGGSLSTHGVANVNNLWVYK